MAILLDRSLDMANSALAFYGLRFATQGTDADAQRGH
jgi:hypothetical protein